MRARRLSNLRPKGLLSRTPNSSTHVNELSPREVNEPFSVRCVLEEYASLKQLDTVPRWRLDSLTALSTKRDDYAFANAGSTSVIFSMTWPGTRRFGRCPATNFSLTVLNGYYSRLPASA